MLRQFLSDEFTLTKRHLGLILLAAGIVALVGAVAVEIVHSGPVRFGTVQKLVMLVGAISLVIGLTLLPLGDRPA
jgi:hypothetical protein